MNPEVLVSAFQSTLNPETLKNGESILSEMQKTPQFFSTVLKLIVEPGVDASVRQAAAVYFKNKIISHWSKYADDDEEIFIVAENDKAIIRENIIPAIISLPAPLQIQLKSCLEKIIRADYPDRFPHLIEKIQAHLNDANFHSLNGALLALYAFCQNYEYSKQSEWLIMDRVMKDMLPGLFSLLSAFYQSKSEESQGLQKLILKCMNAYVAFRFPIDSMSDFLPKWIELLCSITGDFYQPENTDADSLYWKTKKWAANFLVRVSDKYGNPGQVTKKYKAFAEQFLKSFSTQITNTCLQVCAHHHQGNFVSTRVLSTAMKYFTVALCHSFSYKLLRQHFNGLIEQVIHPLLCHNDEDEELWDEDPNEYIRYKFSIWDDFAISGTTDASFTLLQEACRKRKGILQYTMSFCFEILVNQGNKPRAVDGALTMIGAVSELLLKKKAYRTQLELFLVSHVFPAMESKERFIRSRACWLIQKLSSTQFKDQNIVAQIVEATRLLMKNDPEIPVRTMAAVSLFDFVTDQTQIQDLLKPQLPQIVGELLELLRQTEYDELSGVIEKIFYIYKDDIKPISKQIMEELAKSFFLLMNYDPVTGKAIEKSSDADGSPDFESRLNIGEGILENMENIAIIASEKDEILAQLEPSVISVTRAILLNQCEELYENILKCLECMIYKNISPAMWQMFDFIYEAFKNGMRENFMDLMDIIHQYIVADREGFVKQPARIEKVLEMCNDLMIDDEIDSDDHARAAKLLEVLALDYAGQIDAYVPKIVETALTRLSRKIHTKELEIMCLQVISAALFANSEIVLPLLCDHPWPTTTVPIVENFIKQLVENTKNIEGLHDRRLFIMVVCKLLSLPPNKRPAIINNHHHVFLPQLISLMEKLPDCYKAKKELEEDSDDEDDEDENGEGFEDAEGDEEGAGSDEDALDEEDVDYLEHLDKINEDNFADGVGEEDLDGIDGSSMVITDLEMYETVLEKDEHEKEEYGIFYRTMNQLQASEPEWYNTLLGSLSEEQKTTLKQLADLSLKEIEQKEKSLKAGDTQPAIVNLAFC